MGGRSPSVLQLPDSVIRKKEGGLFWLTMQQGAGRGSCLIPPPFRQGLGIVKVEIDRHCHRALGGWDVQMGHCEPCSQTITLIDCIRRKWRNLEAVGVRLTGTWITECAVG